MGFWNWLLGTDEQKTVDLGSDLRASTYVYDGGSAVYSRWDYRASAEQAFARVPHIYRAVKLITGSVSALPWQVVGRDGEPLEPTAHPLAALLRRPNPQQTQADLLEAWTIGYYVGGNGYLQVLREGVQGKGSPIQLVVLRPDRVKVSAPGGQLAGYTYEINENGSQVKRLLPTESVCHLKDYHPLDDWYGLSPVEVAARTLDQMAAGQDWNTALMQQSARPPGALVAEQPLSQGQYEALDKQITDMMSGPRNAGKPLLLEGGLTWQSFGLAPADLDWLDGKVALQRDVAVALGVPPQMLGDTESSTFANYEQARESFYTETVFPLGDKLGDRLTSLLIPLYAAAGSGKGAADLRVTYDRASVVLHSEAPRDVWQRTREAKAAGLLTANEARALLGYPPIDGGDTLTAPQPPGLNPDALATLLGRHDGTGNDGTDGAGKALRLDALDVERAIALWLKHAPPRYRGLLQ